MATRLRTVQRGQSLVEFALGAILLFTLIFGIIEFGRLIYAYSVVANAAREGARFASVNPTATAGDVQAAAQALAVGVPITVADYDVDNDTGTVSVTVTHTFTPVTPFAPTVPLSSTARQYLEVRVPGG